MSIWNKVLLGFIFIAAVAFFYMAAWTLDIREDWQTSAQEHESAIERLESEQLAMLQADDLGGSSLRRDRQLQIDVEKLAMTRGRVWRNCATALDANAAQTGAVTLTISEVVPHGIADTAILHAFEYLPPAEDDAIEEDGFEEDEFEEDEFEEDEFEEEPADDEGEPIAEQPPAQPAAGQQARYLGKFKVTKVGQDTVDLAPAESFSPEECQAVADSKLPWILYEIMPADNLRLFEGLDDKELAQLIDEGSKVFAEYSHHGKMIAPAKVEQLGLRGTVVALDETGNVIHVDQKNELIELGKADDGETPLWVYVNDDPDPAEKKYKAGDPVAVDEEGVVDVNMRLVAQRDVEGRYVRPLQDFGTLLRANAERRTIVLDLIVSANRDVAFVEGAAKVAQSQRQAREREVTQLGIEQADAIRQKNVIDSHAGTLRAELAAIASEVDRLARENRAIAERIGEIQRFAAARINEQTGRMAASGTPAN